MAKTHTSYSQQAAKKTLIFVLCLLVLAGICAMIVFYIIFKQTVLIM